MYEILLQEIRDFFVILNFLQKLGPDVFQPSREATVTVPLNLFLEPRRGKWKLWTKIAQKGGRGGGSSAGWCFDGGTCLLIDRHAKKMEITQRSCNRPTHKISYQNLREADKKQLFNFTIIEI